MTKFLSRSAGVAGLAMVWMGCGKTADTSPDASVLESLTEREMAALETEDVTMEFADVAMMPPGDGCWSVTAGNPGLSGLPECAEITDSGADTDPRIIEVTLPGWCTTPGGWPLGGTMTLELTGDGPWALGAAKTVTFDEFTLGPRTVSGTRNRTVVALDGAGMPTVERSSEMTQSHPWGDIQIVRNGTLAWLAGFDTPEDCADNVWVRNFTATWTGALGASSSRTGTDLVRNAECGHLVSGVLEVSRPNMTFTLDFGAGECDNQAELTVGDDVFLLNLDTGEVTPI